MASKDGETPMACTHELIKDEHVKEALKADKGKDALLVSWTVKDFTQKGDNYATVVTSVSVVFTLNGSDESVSYIVKLHRQILQNFFADFGHVIFIKEAGFYSELAPLLTTELKDIGLTGLRVPKYLCSFLEKESEMIFLEDLRPRGFKMYDRRKGMDVAHARLVLQELAKLHAASVLLQARLPDQDLSEKYEFLKLDWTNYSENAEKEINFLFSHTMTNAKDILQKIGGNETAEEWLEKCKTASFQVMERHLVRSPPFDVICHGDCWNNNILFRYNEEGVPVDIMLVDLQLSRHASAATDLNYFMFTSFNGDVRQANEQDFLTTYYDTFRSVIEAGHAPVPFTHEELLREHRNKYEFGLLFATMAITAVISEAKDIPDMENIKEEDIPAFMEEWKQLTVNTMEKNSRMRTRFLSIFDKIDEKLPCT